MAEPAENLLKSPSNVNLSSKMSTEIDKSLKSIYARLVAIDAFRYFLFAAIRYSEQFNKILSLLIISKLLSEVNNCHTNPIAAAAIEANKWFKRNGWNSNRFHSILFFHPQSINDILPLWIGRLLCSAGLVYWVFPVNNCCIQFGAATGLLYHF